MKTSYVVYIIRSDFSNSNKLLDLVLYIREIITCMYEYCCIPYGPASKKTIIC